jgi:molecular chaperone GrpE
VAKRENSFDEGSSFEFINNQEQEKAEHTSKNSAKVAKEIQPETEKTTKPEEFVSKSTLKEKQQKHFEGSAQQDKSNEVEEYKNLLQLTKAEFDNYRKRSLALLQNAKTEGEINIISKFLPALDSLKKAKDMIFDEKVLKGVEMIETEIVEALKTIGVEEINPKGKKFDANYHNAISVTSNPDAEDGVVEQVYQNGYCYNDKIIRYAQVIINKI